MDRGEKRRLKSIQKRWMDSMNSGLEGEGITREGDAKPGCLDGTGQKHRQHIDSNGPAFIEVKIDAKEED